VRLALDQGQKNDDRQGNAEHPKQNRTSHDLVLLADFVSPARQMTRVKIFVAMTPADAGSPPSRGGS